MAIVTKDELMLLADYISNEYIQDQTKNLNEMIAQIVTEKGFNENQIAALVNEVNRAVFQKLFSIEEDKRFEFPLASTNEVLKLIGSNASIPTFLPIKLHETENLHEKSASLREEFTVDPSDYDLTDVERYINSRELIKHFREGNEKKAEVEEKYNFTEKLRELFKKASEFEQTAKELSLQKVAASKLDKDIEQVLAMLKTYNVSPNQLKQILKKNNIPDPIINQIILKYNTVKPVNVIEKNASLKKQATLMEAERLGKQIIRSLTSDNKARKEEIIEKIAMYDLRKLEEKLEKIGYITSTNRVMWENLKRWAFTKQMEPEVKALDEAIEKVANYAIEMKRLDNALAKFLEKAAELNEECQKAPEFESYCDVIFKKYKANLIQKGEKI